MSAATTLLRFTLESSTSSDRQKVSEKLLEFLNKLKLAQNRHGWDLAQLCIETCGQPIEKLAAACHNASGVEPLYQSRVPPHHTDPAAADLIPGMGVRAQQYTANEHTWDAYDDVLFPLDLDIPWDNLWDDIVEPWQSLNPRYTGI